MNELKIYNHKEFGGIRAFEINSQPWFVGKDVADILGYANSKKALGDHVDDEDKLGYRFVTSGQNRNMTIINESGLYSLILSSKLPKAKAFKRWVTSEVLPQIRRTGGYIAGGDMEAVIQMMTAQVTAAVTPQIVGIVSETIKALLNPPLTDVKSGEVNVIEWKEIAYWEGVLADWREYRRHRPNKDEADRDFINHYNMHHPGAALGRRTLYRKWKAFNEKGGSALLDMRGRHGNHYRKAADADTVQVEITMTVGYEEEA